MKRPLRYPPAINNFQAYLHCASTCMFVLCTGILIAAYSPLHWISAAEITAATHQPSPVFQLLLAATLILSGIQITSMWSDLSTPSLKDMGYFLILHLAAFVTAYLVTGILLLAVESLMVPLTCLFGAIAGSCVWFVHNREKFNEQ